MNLRDLGVVYECEQGKLWMNPAKSPMIADLVMTTLDRLCPVDTKAESTGNHLINNARNAFIIVEAYIMDSEWVNTDHSLAKYLAMREGRTLEERWQLFGHIINTSEWDVIFDAHNATRPADLEVSPNGASPDEKKSTSKPSPEPTPKGKSKKAAQPS